MNRYVLLLAGIMVALSCCFAGAAPPVNVGLNDVIATVEKPFKTGVNGLPPVSDFMADFFQRTLLKQQNREMRGDGQILVKLAGANSPLMYRFNYYRPYQQEIVSDGATLWIYHPENREVMLSDISFLYNRSNFDPERDRAVNFLQGLGRISKDFQINFASGMYDNAGNYVLELTPRRAMLNTRRILLVVSRDNVISNVTGRPSVTQHQPRTPPTTVRPPFSTPTAPLGAPPLPGTPPSDPFPLLSTTVEDHEGNSTTMEFANIRINNRLQRDSFSFSVPPGVQVVRPSEQNLPR